MLGVIYRVLVASVNFSSDAMSFSELFMKLVTA
jgi:hypothetical protein